MIISKERFTDLVKKIPLALRLTFLLLLLGIMQLSAQQGVTVSGKVSDAEGQPLPGVNVIIKGTTQGIVTGYDGDFTLQVPNANAVLVFSYIGYISQEVVVGAKRTINVMLVEDTQTLDEVVVIGYGTVRKSDLTGAVSSVSEKQFRDEPVKRIEDILQGRMAGVEIMSESGMLGGNMRVRVRGTGSINKGSDPIYVVDGIFTGTGLDGLNPSDIQSIEVLKDASATAVYGARGANGVVLVTTKRGTEGKPKISLESSWGWATIAKTYDLMDAYEYATALRDVRGASTIPDADYQGYKNGTLGINWFDMMTQTGFHQDYKLGISGSSGKTRYLVSGQALDQSTYSITAHYNRYQFRTNLDTELTKWFSIKSSINAGIVKYHNNGYDIAAMMAYSPTMKLMDEANPLYYAVDPFNSVAQNPYGNRILNYNDNYRYQFNGNVSFVFKLMDGLTFTSQAGLNFRNAQNYQFTSKYVKFGNQSSINNNWDHSLYWQNTNNLTYSKLFGDHSITATAVWEISNSESKYIEISGSNLGNEEMVGYWNYQNAATRNGANSYSGETMASALIRAMYGFKNNRYLLTATVRADASSKFSKQNKWGYFPSAALAWDIAKEDFFSDQQLFQQLKLRASYGVVGNSAISRYDTLGTLSSGTYGWGTGTAYTGYWSNTFPMPGIRWEKSLTTDIAVDFSILKGRVSGSIDWFNRRTIDLLFRRSVPFYNGGGTFWDNLGEVQNTGVEVSINATPVRNKDFSWETTLNVTYMKNKIVDMGGEELIIHATQTNIGGSMMGFKLGYPVNSFYLQQFVGYNDKGSSLYLKADGSTTTDPLGVDQVMKGQADPKWDFGFNNSVSWRNWSASIFLSAKTGFQKLNLMRFNLAGQNANYKFTRLRESYYQSWDNVKDKADAKYPTLKNYNRALGVSDFWLEDASFLRLKNLSLAYTVPQSFLKVASATISISAQNLFTLTKYQGTDPESFSAWIAQAGMTNAPSGMSGIDENAIPSPRTYTLGLKLNF